MNISSLKVTAVFLVSLLFASPLESQTKEQLAQQAKSQLSTMTPDQIDAKIKEYGMTRAEAEAKAKANGIDLETYLSKMPGSGTPNNGTTIQIQEGSSTVKIETKPATAAAIVSPVPAAGDAIGLQNSAAVDSAAFQKPEVILAIPQPKSKTKFQTQADTVYFGYSIFKSASGSFEPRPYIDDQYVLGEGDVLKISLSGEVQSYNEYTVNKDGRILVTGVGPIFVSGYTVEKAKKSVMGALGNAYSGLVRTPPAIFMDLSVARIRPVRIFMTGEVENPGGYAVSNFGNVFNSLFAVGGPKTSGSLRDVRVIRNNKVVSKVDVYDYLFGSPKSADVRINDNDIIFVPLRGKTVAIAGAVLRPFTYELLPGENIKKLIEFSGGFRSNIYTDRVQIDRIIPYAGRVKGTDDRKIFDIDFRDIAAGAKDYTLEDGDVVTVYPILDKKDNFVFIAGDVKRPGRYQFDKIRTVRDLITAADGLWPTAYLKRAELMREYPDGKKEMFVLDVEKVMAGDGTQNIPLVKKDSIKIYNTYELNAADSITVFGHAQKAGSYPYADRMTVRKLLYSLVGLEDSTYRANTYLDRGDIFRLNDDLISRRRIEFSPSKILDCSMQDVPILPGDRIRIYGLNEIDFLDKTIEIFGNVKKPGKYPLTRDLTVTDLILLAGGYTQDASTQRGEIARMTRIEKTKDSIVTITFSSLPDLFDATRSAQSIIDSEAGSFLLKDKDQLFIRPNPNYKIQELVTVSGKVKYPGKYAISVAKERISDVIARAGSVQNDGYARGGVIMRNGERLRANIDEAINTIGGKYDAVLFPGDSIYIPKSPSIVHVWGEVNNPGWYSFVDNEDRDFYIKLAGGITDSSDFALVTSPEGFVTKTNFPWIFTDSPSIADGSSIYVKKVIPPKPKTPSEEKGTTFVDVFKETTAIAATTLTLLLLTIQLNK